MKLLYYKSQLENGYTIYFDAISKDAAEEYASYKARLQNTKVISVKTISKKEALRYGLDCD